MTNQLPEIPRNLTVPAEIIISTARSDEERSAFYMRVSEWNRLKRAAQRIQPVIAWWSIAASVFGGLALSCFANWIVASRAKVPDAATVNANGYLTITAVLLTVICVIADHRERKRTTEDAAELLQEMNLIERSNEAVFPTVSSRAE